VSGTELTGSRAAMYFLTAWPQRRPATLPAYAQVTGFRGWPLPAPTASWWSAEDGGTLELSGTTEVVSRRLLPSRGDTVSTWSRAGGQRVEGATTCLVVKEHCSSGNPLTRTSFLVAVPSIDMKKLAALRGSARSTTDSTPVTHTRTSVPQTGGKGGRLTLERGG